MMPADAMCAGMPPRAQSGLGAGAGTLSSYPGRIMFAMGNSGHNRLAVSLSRGDRGCAMTLDSPQ